MHVKDDMTAEEICADDISREKSKNYCEKFEIFNKAAAAACTHNP